jgi:hypothetical protein
MKILIDECLPAALQGSLTAQGHECQTGRSVSILILCAKSNRMKDLLPIMPACAQALLCIQPGRVVEVGAS